MGMHQHFWDTDRKIVSIVLLMKHMVTTQRENMDEISSGQEVQAKINAAADCFGTSKIATTHSFDNVIFVLKKSDEHSHSVTKLLTNKGE